jgi:HSP20 family protein
MDRLYDEHFGRRYAREERPARLAIDAYTTDDALVITAAIPGVSPEDVDVTFEGDVLTIKGELAAPLGNVDYVVQERLYGPFARTLNVGIPIQADKIEATFDRGLLTVTLPKVEEVKPKAIKVKAKAK